MIDTELVVDDEIKLVQFDEKYAEQITAIANNKKVSQNLTDDFPFPYQLSDAIDFINLCKTLDPSVERQYLITVNGEAAGGFGIFFKKGIYRKISSFGYWLGEKFWGRGIMTRVVKFAVNYVFTNFDIMRISIGIFARNTGSKRVLEKSGFKCEGLFKKFFYKDDEYCDGLIYTIMRDEV